MLDMTHDRFCLDRCRAPESHPERWLFLCARRVDGYSRQRPHLARVEET